MGVIVIPNSGDYVCVGSWDELVCIMFGNSFLNIFCVYNALMCITICGKH